MKTVDLDVFAVGCAMTGGLFVLATMQVALGDAVKAAVLAVLAVAYGVLSAIRLRRLRRTLRGPDGAAPGSETEG